MSGAAIDERQSHGAGRPTLPLCHGAGAGALEHRERAGERGACRDSRFKSLVGEEAWLHLPEPVRCRLSKSIPAGAALLYEGDVVLTELSIFGRLLAFLARVIGGPLPLDDGATGPSVVSVTGSASSGAQTWLRSYARPGRPPQIVRSTKRFQGATGLEEHVGAGFGMALGVTVESGALVFRSSRYFVDLWRLRVTIPRSLAPGVMEIVHREEGGGRFSFSLTLTHPRLGRLIHQLAYFKEGRFGPAP